MQNSPMEEWQRLTEVYREKYDGELLELAADSADLTEVAQQVLRDEMKKRGLELPRAATAPQAEPARASEPRWAPAANPPDSENPEEQDDLPHEYTWKTVLCECGDQEQALQIREVLRRAGIESWIEGPGGSYSPYSQLDRKCPRIMVAADRFDQARMIAEQPILQDIIDQSKEEPQEYELPVCPKCGAADPVLEGADPVNSWHCDACGNDWSDPAEVLDEDLK